MQLTRRTLLSTSVPSALAIARPAVAQPRSVLKFIPISDLTGIDPIWTTSTAVRNHGYLVYDKLFGIDSGFAVRPQMAESFSVSEDAATVTIRLRGGLVFHDGTPVLGRDCTASIRRWAARDGLGQVLLTLLDELSAPDDRTIQFRLKAPAPWLIASLGQLSSPAPFMMPEHVAQTDPNTRITSTIGSGPFRFLPDEWVQGSHVAYERFDRYNPRSEPANGTAGGKSVHVDRVEWDIVPDVSTAVSSLQTGAADWYETAPADLIPLVAKDPNVVLTTLDPAGYPILLRLNQLQPPFNSVVLRRAVLGAVDQAAFLQAAVGDDSYTSTCKSFLPCGTPFSIGTGSGMMTGNLEAARNAVRASGYDGTKAVILAPSDNPVVSGCCAVADALFKQIGINSELAVMDIATMIARRTSMEPVTNGGWSAFVSYGESAQFSNPATHIALRADGKAAWPGWPTDPALQELRREFLTAPTDAARRDLASRIEQQAFLSVPYIPLGQFRQPTIYRRAVSGVLTQGIPLFWNLRKA